MELRPPYPWRYHMRIKKALLFISIVFLLSIQCNAYAARGTVRRLFNAETINATAVVSSDAITVKSGGIFGVWYQATSVLSTPDVKFEVEMSYDKTDGNFIEPENMNDIVTALQDETVHVKGVHPPPMKYLRVKCTGGATNPADTLVTMYLFTQE